MNGALLDNLEVGSDCLDAAKYSLDIGWHWPYTIAITSCFLALLTSVVHVLMLMLEPMPKLKLIIKLLAEYLSAFHHSSTSFLFVSIPLHLHVSNTRQKLFKMSRKPSIFVLDVL